MKKFLLTLALVVPLALSAQIIPSNDNLAKLIREREKFPRRYIASLPMVLQTYGKETDFSKIDSYDREHKWMEAGLIKVEHSDVYNQADSLRKQMGINVKEGGVFDVTTQYFVAYLVPGNTQYLVPDSEWNNPGTSFAGRISPSDVGRAYSTMTNVPESVRTLPAYVGAVDMGTVDFAKILHTESKDMVAEIAAKLPEKDRAAYIARAKQLAPQGMHEITVWWQGQFTVTTPFSVAVNGFGPDDVFKTTYQLLGSDISNFKTRGYTLEEFNAR